MRNRLLTLALALFGFSAMAVKAQVKVGDINTEEDTAIVIKKGAKALDGQCTEYQIVEGKDEINGAPDYDKSKARSLWDVACKEWKTSMREMNKDNQVLVLNCNRPSPDKEGETYVYHSAGSYKMKVKTKDRL